MDFLLGSCRLGCLLAVDCYSQQSQDLTKKGMMALFPLNASYRHQRSRFVLGKSQEKIVVKKRMVLVVVVVVVVVLVVVELVVEHQECSSMLE